MAVSDSNKRAHAKWNAANMKTVSAIIKREDAEEFSRLCRANGETMHSVLKKAIEDYISEHK